MSAATSHILPDFYRWSFPGAPIQIYLSLEVVSKLRKLIQDSGKEAGAQCCGLLTGDTRKAGITRILSFKSLHTLDAASVEAARGSGSGEVVGFYSASPTSGVAMPDADRALATSLFGHPTSVFLLIETGTAGIGDAHFGFWGEGQLFDWPLMLFPFDAELLAGEEEKRRLTKVRELSLAEEGAMAHPQVEQTATPPAPDAASKLAAGPVAKPQRETRRRWLVPLLSAALAVAVSAAVFLYFPYFRSGNVPVVSPTAGVRADVKAPLGLAVERRGSDLRISWNSNSALIARAEFGMLLIRGTQVSRDVPLTADELRSGSVVYAAPADEVRFQLNVVTGEQVTREFLTVLLPGPGENKPVVTITKGAPPAVPVVPKAAGQPQSPLLTGSETAKELRQFKPVDLVPATATPLRLDDAPPVSAAAPSNSGTPDLLKQPLVSLPSSLPASSPTPSQAPAQVPTQSAPQVEAPATAGASPPVATNKVIPPVPSLLRGTIWKPVIVEVTVSVNAAGNVVKAEAVRKPGVNPLLSDAAVQAARRWKFRPAQFDGHPVPADIVLQFSFAGSR